MNNCRAGLYSFALTTTWLHETGMASPPFLVMLGLTLPDSRILNGIASIGLTLANIANILPYLRQPTLDSIYAHECTLADVARTQAQINSSDGFDATQPVDLKVESLCPAPIPPCDGKHQGPLLPRSTTVKSVCSAGVEPPQSLSIDSQLVSHPGLLPSTEKTDDVQVPLQVYSSLDADSTRTNINLGDLLARRGRGPLDIPLPVPDAMEVVFFDTSDAASPDGDLEEEYPTASCTLHGTEEHSLIEIEKVIDQDDRFITTSLSSKLARVEIRDDLTDVFVAVGSAPFNPTKTATEGIHHNPVTESNVSCLLDDIAARGETVQNVQTGHSSIEGTELSGAKRRPESLAFIPQSVLRRYPSAQIESAERCSGHRTFSSGNDYQFPPTPPHVLIHNPVVLLEGTRPRAGYATLEGYWRASFVPEAHPNNGLTGEQTFVAETQPAQDPLQKGSASLPEPLRVHEVTPLRKYPSRRRRLGVLARAALRNRRNNAHQRRNDTNDGSSTSDSDSESDSDSQSSNGSSADESMLPHILGTDLIAAIDANSESELNLVGSRMTMTMSAPLYAYEDFLVSEGSAADVSMLMHLSSNGDAFDGDVRVPATFHALTHEDIHQWASGVIPKCARQVCRGRAPAELLSPSQVSDVCAEKPSGSGTSQCPFSGLYCELGAATLAEAPGTKQPPVPLPHALPSRKLPSMRKLRDIPEFVPRQRQASGGVVEDPRKAGTRVTIDVTRDAATEVIARMESQAGFDTRQQLVNERWIVGTIGRRQGTRRCA